MSGVALRGIEKRFGPVEVLRGIDLEIEPGELVVLLGRSGCGKSTLLRIIAGLDEQTSGEVWLGGRRVDGVEPRERNVSMVFQSYALFPNMTVEQNLGFALTVRKVEKGEKRERVLEAAKSLGIEDLLGRYPRELSGGQRQRVAIGRAIVRRPDIFLLDEPLSNLDAALRAKTRVELKALHERLGATMIYVTHDQTEAMTLADRVVLLEKGRIEQVGPPGEIYRRPRNLFVAGFIGTPTMNLIDAPGMKVGIRPEDLKLHPKLDRIYPINDGVSVNQLTEDLRLGVRGTVELIEPIGDRGHIHLRSGRVTLVATIEGAKAFEMRPGLEVAVSAQSTALHRFDATGVRIEDEKPIVFSSKSG